LGEIGPPTIAWAFAPSKVLELLLMLVALFPPEAAFCALMIQKTDTNPLTAYYLIMFLLSDSFLISIGTYRLSPSKLSAPSLG
jgi:hypothetical protein